MDFAETLSLERPIDDFCCAEVYLSYLYFQFFSHKRLYDDNTELKPATVNYLPHDGPSRADLVRAKARQVLNLRPAKGDAEQQRPEDEIETEPELSMLMTVILLIVVKMLIAVTAEWFLDSINGLANGGGISKQFIGLILIPIVGNAAECAATVTASTKDKLTLSLGVAIGSSVVSSLFLLRCGIVDSPPSSKWHYLVFHPSSFLGGSSVGRSPCSSTRSSQLYSSSPS